MNPQKRVTIIIAGGVRLKNLPDDLKKQVRADLTFKNKEYENAKKYGKWVAQDCMPTVEFFYEDKATGQLFVPKGYTSPLLRLLRFHGIPYRIDDKTIKLTPIDFVFNGTLRGYQEDALKDLMSYPNGVLEAKTGSGKTVMGIAMIAKRQQPTLIIVHSKELMNQWKAQIKKLLGFNAGMIGDGKYEIKDITIGIINSVKPKIGELKKRFGMVICDECHRVPSTTFTDAIIHLQAKFLLGLSATAFRNDGLDRAINAFMGPRMHTVNAEELYESGAVLKPDVYRVATNFYYPSSEYQKIISKLSVDPERNLLIAKVAVEDLKRQNQPLLIAVGMVKSCQIISDELKKLGYSSHILTGSVSSDRRERIIKDLKAGKIKILIATISLIAEGFDAPNLHSLLLASPIKYSGKVIQIGGRILRPEEGKTARIYDFIDVKVPLLYRQGNERKKVYKQQGWVDNG